LYGQLEAFDEPVPSDAPFEYEVEELEAWEKLRAQIRALEHALAEINKKKGKLWQDRHVLHRPCRQGSEEQSPGAETCR
jgi:hypothetical protein